MNIQSHDFDGIQLSRLIRTFVVCLKFILYTYRYNWIEWQGSKYSSSDFIWYGYENELPCFGKVFSIVSVKQTFFLCLKVYRTKGTGRHSHSFVIEPTEKNVLYPLFHLNKLQGWIHPLQAHTMTSSQKLLHITTKCIVFKITTAYDSVVV